MNGKLIFSGIKFILLITIPIVLLLLPGNYFDDRASICLSVLLFDAECYGCGLTRACMHLIHGHFFEAFQYNALSYVAFPVLAYQWAVWGWKEFSFLRTTFQGRIAGNNEKSTL